MSEPTDSSTWRYDENGVQRPNYWREERDRLFAEAFALEEQGQFTQAAKLYERCDEMQALVDPDEAQAVADVLTERAERDPSVTSVLMDLEEVTLLREMLYGTFGGNAESVHYLDHKLARAQKRLTDRAARR